jgi:2-oxoisovalerate dehydrogenase E1 component
VSEAVVAALVNGGFTGRTARMNSRASDVPLGPAADRVLLGKADILRAAHDLLGDRPRSPALTVGDLSLG